MNEQLFHELMDALYDLAGRADQDPHLAWELPKRVVSTAIAITHGTPAEEWVQRWKDGKPPVGQSVLTEHRML